MFKIGEFSKLTQVSIRMLRYYDDMDLLKPAQIDANTKYRLYTSDQIEVLHKIIFLRELGFGVVEMKDMLMNWQQEAVIKKLKLKEEETRRMIEKEQQKLAQIRAAIEQVHNKQIEIATKVVIKAVPRYFVFSLRREVLSYFHEGLLWKEIGEYIKAHQLNIPLNSFSFAIYHDAEYKECDVDIEVCMVTEERGQDKEGFCFREVEPLEQVASFMVYGPYEKIAPHYLAFARWLEQHSQYGMEGSSRQICHRGPWNEEDPKDYMTEIQIPIHRRIDSHMV